MEIKTDTELNQQDASFTAPVDGAREANVGLRRALSQRHLVSCVFTHQRRAMLTTGH